MNQHTDYEMNLRYREELMQRGQEAQRAEALKSETPKRNFYSPALARLGSALTGIGENLQERHGERREATQPIHPQMRTDLA